MDRILIWHAMGVVLRRVGRADKAAGTGELPPGVPLTTSVSLTTTTTRTTRG